MRALSWVPREIAFDALAGVGRAGVLRGADGVRDRRPLDPAGAAGVLPARAPLRGVPGATGDPRPPLAAGLAEAREAGGLAQRGPPPPPGPLSTRPTPKR